MLSQYCTGRYKRKAQSLVEDACLDSACQTHELTHGWTGEHACASLQVLNLTVHLWKLLQLIKKTRQPEMVWSQVERYDSDRVSLLAGGAEGLLQGQDKRMCGLCSKAPNSQSVSFNLIIKKAFLKW